MRVLFILLSLMCLGSSSIWAETIGEDERMVVRRGSSPSLPAHGNVETIQNTINSDLSIPFDYSTQDIVDKYNFITFDEKIYAKVDETPFKYIVKVSSGCTGSILLHPKVILTNSHCILDWIGLDGEYNGEGKVYALKDDVNHPVFVANVKNLVYGVLDDRNTAPYSFVKRDWALLELDKPLGHVVGYFKSVNSYTDPDSDDTKNVTLAGYSADIKEGNVMSFHQGCKIYKGESIKDKVLYHNCDSMDGASGSPIFKCTKKRGCFIVALNAFARRAESIDFGVGQGAVNTSRFYDVLKAIVDNDGEINDDIRDMVNVRDAKQNYCKRRKRLCMRRVWQTGHLKRWRGKGKLWRDCRKYEKNQCGDVTSIPKTVEFLRHYIARMLSGARNEACNKHLERCALRILQKGSAFRRHGKSSNLYRQCRKYQDCSASGDEAKGLENVKKLMWVLEEHLGSSDLIWKK